MKKLLLMMMALVLSIPIWAGEKTIVINRNEGIYEDGTGAYYCTKGGITMTFSSGLNNVNYLVEHQQVVFDIFSTNYVIKKIKFNCLDNTLEGNMDCFYWGPTTISEFIGAPYEATGTYVADGYIGTWTGGSTPSKYVKFVTRGKPVRFGSVEITIDKEFGDIYDLVTQNSQVSAGGTYALVSKYDSRALGKEEFHGSDPVKTFSSTPVTLLNFDAARDNYMQVRVTDEVSLMKLESSGDSNRPFYIKIGDNYLRRRSGDKQGSGGPANGQGFNIYTESSVPTDNRAQYFRTNITVENNNNNALIRHAPNSFNSSEAPLGNETFAVRHYNGGDLFRVIDYNSANNQYTNNQRVYLYKPAQVYYVTTNCLPNDNSGYITLGDGVLNDGNGNYTSQQYDNVSFFVGPTDGWGVGAVTVTNLSTNEVTTLSPTATSDFGNDYQFPMPAANVSVTANFLSPVEIDTICNPANGGQFNFINGYTNFNGQYYSNEGKTVTFKPSAADGYIFQSVTITDNGVTTTMTPDADGVYSFVMPDHEVTLAANFEEAHDLYLLGTANGGGWAPSGPKFNFDGENQVYYLDVYFKGDVSNSDPNGHFSLTKKIPEPGSTNPWNDILAYRLVANWDGEPVQDGSTDVTLYPTSERSESNAFSIPAGVYRITVNPEMTLMSIAKYDLWLTFNPESGSTVESGQVVTIGTNLEELVHAINPDENDFRFYNTTDNWAHQEDDNTAEITAVGTTTVKASSTLGYIVVNGEAQYEIIGDLYLLGTANGKNEWLPYGPKFTYDASTQTYSLDAYFTGLNVNAADEGFGYFSLSTVISTSQQPTWNDIPNSARYNAQYNDFPIDGLAYNQSTTADLYQTDPNWCFKIDPGVYTITVNKNKTEITVTKHELTLTFNPASGTTVAAGDEVNISSNLLQLVHAINPDETLNETIKYATSTDNTLPTPTTEGSTVAITAVGETTTVNAEAKLGYITVTGNANYNIPAPAAYSITTVVDPEGSGAITAPVEAVVGTTVTFTVNTNDGYRLDEVQVTYGYSHAILEYTYDPATGEYSFVMPDDEVIIYADYSEYHSITTVVNPDGSGTITAPDEAVAGETVTFTVTNNDPTTHSLSSVTVVSDGTPATVTVTDNGDGTYSFTMPEGNVTITADYEVIQYTVTTSWTPSDGGAISLNGVNTPQTISIDNGAQVVFGVETNTDEDYRLISLTVMNLTTNQEITYEPTSNSNEYSFTMPAANVSITAEYSDLYNITIVSNPADVGTIKVYHVVNGNTQLHPAADVYHNPAGENIQVTVSPIYGYLVNSVTVTKDGTDPIEIVEHTTNGVGTYIFDMPAADVTVTVNYIPGYRIRTAYFPGPDCGNIEVVDHADANEVVQFTVTPSDGYALSAVYVYEGNYDDEGTSIDFSYENGTYSFTMPASDVVVKARFITGEYVLTPVIVPEGAGYMTFNGPWYDEVNDLYRVHADQPIRIFQHPNEGWVFDHVEITDPDGNVLISSRLDQQDFRTRDFDFTVTAYYVRPSHNITTVVSPPAAGTINVQGSATEGETVNFTLTTSSPLYTLVDVVMTYVDENNVIQSVTLIPDGDGNYSFEMPEADVTITANYNAPPTHNINSIVNPEGAGNVSVQSQAMEGETVTFRLIDNPNAFDSYNVYAVTLTTVDSHETITLTPTNGIYSFVMPNEDVLITAEYRREFTVTVRWTPEDGGTAVIQGTIPSTSSLRMEGTTVTIEATPNTHFEVASITSLSSGLTFNDNGDGTYSFEMPQGNVLITVTFAPVGEYQVNLVNDPAGGGSISLSGHVKTEDGNYYSDEGETVVITPVPTAGWTLTGVDVVDENNNPVGVTDNGNGSYSLVMPASNVTVTAHYEALPYTITTQVISSGWGEIVLMGDAADYTEYAGQTVNFTVEPGFGYGVKEAYYTYGGTDYPLTDDDGDGIYSFVMPASNVKIVVKMTILHYIFRQVYNTRDIVEGGTYIYVNKCWGFVMTYYHPDETSSWLINEFLQPDRSRIKVDRNALMFEAVNVVDTTYASQHLFYGSMEEEHYKATYLQCKNNGKYLGLSEEPSYPYPVEFYDAVTPDNHDNLRALLRLQNGRYWFHGLNLDEGVWSYYPNVWSNPMTTDVSSGVLHFGYMLHYDETPETFNINCVYLYKMPQPYTVTTQCVEPDWGTIDLTGVVDNIAMDGDTIIVTPHGIGDHGCAEVIVTINDTNEQIEVTRNPDRTFTFVMPAADVTVTAYFDDGHTLTMTFNPEMPDDEEPSVDYDYVSLDGLVLEEPTYFVHAELPEVVRETNIMFEVWAGDDYEDNAPEGYVVESVTMDADGVVTEIPCRWHNLDNLTFGYYCVMPDADATISVNLLPAHLVTYKAILNGEQAPDSCGRVGYYTETLIPRINYFVENEEVVLEVHQQPGFRLVDVTVVNDETGEPIEFSTYKDPTGLPGINASYFYKFIMPDEPVTVTAYFERFTPLSFIEQDRTESLNPPVSEDHVVVSDELIGVWAVKNLLWAKDQSPYKAYDSSEDPGDTYDYVRQNMKLQKHEWDQSNWVILDFSQLSGWQGNESDYIRVEEFVDHKIKAGSISGIYYCEGNLVKAQHEIVLDAWPVLANPDDRNSLGYPGYLEDPKEELTTYDYHYNHYVPSNFLKENIGGRYGEAGTYGAVPGNPSPVYRDVRLFFMNPKDDEVAQVWAVWYGSMEFYDEYSNQDITADVFETFVPDYNNGVNVFGLEGAFYVPSWEYNRKSSDRNDYGKPTGDNTLEKNTDYLFHIAIQRHGESEYPGPVSKAGQGTQATSTKPWTYYMVYPLDLEPDKSISTSVKEVNPPATTTIDSIRYYNMMGQESQTPFDGINIMVIRYKDGSFISKKILR